MPRWTLRRVLAKISLMRAGRHEFMKTSVTIATRRSALALAQARAWMQHFTSLTGVATQELHVVTTGDRIVDRPLNEIGGKGLFIKEIEEALLDNSADVAVHSLKDVPAELAPGLALACIPRREDARDVIKTRTGCRFEELPSGAKVGTSSLRRVVQLKLVRPDLTYLPLRGNVDTRLRKCDEGEVDAVVLAMAGMNRLGFQARYTHAFEPEVCLPAIGQGALGIETRANDAWLASVLSAVNDTETELCVAAERGIMLAVQGSCQVPVAGYAQRLGAEMWIRGLLAEPDGSNLRRREVKVEWPRDASAAFDAGKALGAQLYAS
jgi:hydroxymethylbilane synthase